MRTLFINTHPIQYFAPLYRYLNQNGVPTECWYCSDENVKGHLDRQFGTRVEWDVPLLEGYTPRFFKNYSLRPTLYAGFFGLFNPGMVTALFKEPASVVVVHGWSCLTHVLVIVFGRLAGHRVCLRGENPLNQELLKGSVNRLLKRVVLQGFLFRFVNRFCYIGSQNKAFYHYYGVKDRKLVYTPYAVDNELFRRMSSELKPRRGEIRKSLGIPPEAKVILYAAKFIDKKRPMDLVKAFEKVSVPGKLLVMVGDGKLRPALEAYCASHDLAKNVLFPGFVNQTEIPKYYATADVFVLCSGAGETWGLSVNEAMNFDLPIVVSDIAGCGYDLVEEGRTGHGFRTGDVEDLAIKIEQSLALGSVEHRLLEQFSFAGIAGGLRQGERDTTR